MKLNQAVRTTYSQNGVPKYSEKYKDVLNRFYYKQNNTENQVQQSHQYHRIRLLGLGASSMVYIVLQSSTRTLYAQKIIKKSIIEKNSYLPTEIKIHLFLNHPNLITLYHCYQREDSVYLLMELGQESLFTIKANKISKFNCDQIILILRDILQGISYMHSLGLVHGDLKLQNLVKSEGKIKICDFGYTHKAYNPISKEMVGTLQYLPPQYVQGTDSAYKRDIWALGIICYELLSGRNPLDNISQQKKWLRLLQYGKWSNDAQELHKIEGTNYIIKRFLEKTLCKAEERASAEELLNLLITF